MRAPFGMKSPGAYRFETDLRYGHEHNGKTVHAFQVDELVAKCRTEDGRTFAAFTSDLHHERGVTGRGEDRV